jgi:hypothetical protein
MRSELNNKVGDCTVADPVWQLSKIPQNEGGRTGEGWLPSCSMGGDVSLFSSGDSQRFATDKNSGKSTLSAVHSSTIWISAAQKRGKPVKKKRGSSIDHLIPLARENSSKN